MSQKKDELKPYGHSYNFDLIELDDGSFQLCILLDALTADEAKIEADEIVSIWNANCAGLS